MANGYDIGQLLNLAFGIKGGVVFNIPKPPSVNDVQAWAGFNQFKPEIKEDEARGTETRKSWMGTTVMFPMKLKGGAEILQLQPKGNSQHEFKKASIGDFWMPAVTLCDFSREKTIVTTPVLGTSSTVKEIFGFEDWKIRIRGLCLDEPGIRTAQQQKYGLAAYERVVGGIDVEGYLFDQFEIFSIVIKSITFRQIEGKPWVIPFEIDAESDEPLELAL